MSAFKLEQRFSFATENKSREQLIEDERVRLLLSSNTAVLAATAFLALIICYTLRYVVPFENLVAWLAIFLSISVGRFFLVRLYRADPHRFSTQRWNTLFVSGTALAGCAWGIAAVLFFTPDHVMLMLLMTCLYAIVVAVATQALSLSMPAFLSFSLPMIVPLMIQLVAAGGEFYGNLGSIGLLYLVAIAAFARNNHRVAIESIRIRFENKELIERLSREMGNAEKSRQQAEDANRAKSVFLAAASHDLRQPLHALMLFQNALEPHVKPAGANITASMNESTEALRTLFDSLLDISKLDAGTIEVYPQNVFLPDLLRPSIADFYAQASEKGLIFESKIDDEFVFVDRMIVERVVRNLLANAIRYTDSGSISVLAKRQNEQVHISVIDTGCGIEKSDAENIFSEFYQLNNPARDRNKGLGLGLAIVRRLCNLIDIKITLDSTPGKGSSFSIAIPLGKEMAIEQEVPTNTWDLHNKTALIVDDEVSILQSMVDVMERWGVTVYTARSYGEAMSIVTETKVLPDVIVADYRLEEDENGIDVIRGVRDTLNRDIPALLVSGDTAPDRLREVQASGLRLLHKPVPPANLRTAIYQEIINYRG